MIVGLVIGLILGLILGMSLAITIVRIADYDWDEVMHRFRVGIELIKNRRQLEQELGIRKRPD